MGQFLRFFEGALKNHSKGTIICFVHKKYLPQLKNQQYINPNPGGYINRGYPEARSQM
jgi:hypothetical protein